jgi:hypothetical protein
MSALLEKYYQNVIQAKEKVIVCPTASNNIAFRMAVKNYRMIKRYLTRES